MKEKQWGKKPGETFYGSRNKMATMKWGKMLSNARWRWENWQRKTENGGENCKERGRLFDFSHFWKLFQVLRAAHTCSMAAPAVFHPLPPSIFLPLFRGPCKIFMQVKRRAFMNCQTFSTQFQWIWYFNIFVKWLTSGHRHRRGFPGGFWGGFAKWKMGENVAGVNTQTGTHLASNWRC